MSIKKTITTAAILAGFAAMSVATFGSAAEAYDGRGYGNDGWKGHAPTYQHAAPPARHYSYQGERDRHHDRDKTYARGLAIGLGAVIIGGILAAEANRQNRHDYE